MFSNEAFDSAKSTARDKLYTLSTLFRFRLRKQEIVQMKQPWDSSKKYFGCAGNNR